MLIVSVSGQATTDDALALPHGAHFIMPSVDAVESGGAFTLRKAAVKSILERESAKRCFSEEERAHLATFLKAEEPFFTTANWCLFELIVNNTVLIEHHIDLWQRFAFGIVPLPEDVLKEYVISPERKRTTLSFIFDTAKRAYNSRFYSITKDGSVLLDPRPDDTALPFLSEF